VCCIGFAEVVYICHKLLLEIKLSSPCELYFLSVITCNGDFKTLISDKQ
jgi:hypothetical protein